MFFPNFLTFTLETPILSRLDTPLAWWQRRSEDTEEKEKYHRYFLTNRVQEENKFFHSSKRVHRTYVTVANQSTVHRTNPTKKKNTISANRCTEDNSQLPGASPSNKSFRTNTFVRRWHTHTCKSSQIFLLDRKNTIGRNQSFSPTWFRKHPRRCLQNHRPKNICILLTFKRPANL